MECSKLNRRKCKIREIGEDVSPLSDSDTFYDLDPEDVVDENSSQRYAENASDISIPIPDTCEMEEGSVQIQASSAEGTNDFDFHLTSELVQRIEASDNSASMIKIVDDSAKKFQIVESTRYDCLRDIDCQLSEEPVQNNTTVSPLSGIKMGELKNEYAPLKVSWDALTNLIQDDDYSLLLPTASNIDETRAIVPSSDKEVPSDTNISIIGTPPVSSKAFKNAVLSKEFKNTSWLGVMKAKLLTLSPDSSAKHKIGIRSAEEGQGTLDVIADDDLDLLWGPTWVKDKEDKEVKAEILSSCSNLDEAKRYWKSKFAYNVVNKTADGKFELISRKPNHTGNDDLMFDYKMCELKYKLDHSELNKVGQARITKYVATAESEEYLGRLLSPSQAQVPESANTSKQQTSTKNTMLRKISQWVKKITK